MNEIASRYATALFSLAIEQDSVLSMQNEIKELRKIFSLNKEFVTVLGSAFLTPEERIEMLNKTLVGVTKEIVSLLSILIENNRSKYILDVFDAFNSLCNEYREVDEGILYSAMRLNESQIALIEEKISQLENNKVELRNIVDPALIGGIKIVINDHVYDGSVVNKINNMKNDLMK